MDDKLIKLEKACIKVKAGNDQMLELIRDLRAEGVSWTRIGKALGVSRQAAWRKYQEVEQREPAGPDLARPGTPAAADSEAPNPVDGASLC